MEARQILFFIHDFHHHLTDGQWLPFVSSPSYEVEKPNAEEINPVYPIFEFKLSHQNTYFGDIRVTPSFVDKYIKIGHVRSYLRSYLRKGTAVPTKNIGRELVRRTVLYAVKMGMREVQTTPHILDGGSFWLSIGFRCYKPVEPDWSRAHRASKEEILFWQKQIRKDPNILSKLAQTKTGRSVLFGLGGSSRLDLSDEKQCCYAFSRLMLPYNHG